MSNNKQTNWQDLRQLQENMNRKNAAEEREINNIINNEFARRGYSGVKVELQITGVGTGIGEEKGNITEI